MHVRSRVRVLVVDDFERFRRFISLTLRQKPELEIVGEVSDGLEAIQKAEETQPDLILLDLGLPKLNGIQAARRIRMLCPESKILFVSQESSAAVAQEALDTGAVGYVFKPDAGRELLAAVQTVLEGGVFVSSNLAGQVCVHTSVAQASENIARRRVVVSSRQEISRRHEVGFFADSPSLVEGFSRFIQDELKNGNAVLVVARESHRERLVQRLKSNGVDVSAAISEGNYIPLDVADILAAFFVHDVPDPDRFRKVAGDIITTAKAGKGDQTRLAVCGECAPTLLAEGKAEAAIQLEHLWDENVRRYDTDTLCGYLSDDFKGTENSRVFERICTEHSAVRTA